METIKDYFNQQMKDYNYTTKEGKIEYLQGFIDDPQGEIHRYEDLDNFFIKYSFDIDNIVKNRGLVLDFPLHEKGLSELVYNIVWVCLSHIAEEMIYKLNEETEEEEDED